MKAFRTVIDKGFKEVGINPDGTANRNSGLFFNARNVKSNNGRLEGYIPIISDILDPARLFLDSITSAEVTITRRWPFPQVFMTDVGIFIGALEGLYWVIEPNPIPVPDIMLHSFGTGTVIWPWVCVPILGHPAFANGSVFVYYDSNALSYVVVS